MTTEPITKLPAVRYIIQVTEISGPEGGPFVTRTYDWACSTEASAIETWNRMLLLGNIHIEMRPEFAPTESGYRRAFTGMATE